MAERHRGFEVGNPDAPNRILWIHGYTGSPDAFRYVVEDLAQQLDACITVPLLPGHGTEELHLIKYTFEDLLASAHHFASRVAAHGKPYAIVGYSFGSIIALMLAQEHMPRALVLALAPYRLRFPLNLPGVEWFLNLRPFWRKLLTAEDIEARRGTFYYPDFPGATISFTKIGLRRIKKNLPQVTCPILTLNTADDPMIEPQSGQELLAASGKNKDNEWHILPHGRHALFFPPHHDVEEELVVRFLKKQLN